MKKNNQINAFSIAAIYKNMAQRGINPLRFTQADLPVAMDGVQFTIEFLIQKLKYEGLRNKKVGPDFSLHRWYDSPNNWMLLKSAPEKVFNAAKDPSRWRSRMLNYGCKGDCSNCHPGSHLVDPKAHCRGQTDKQQQLSSIARSMTQRLDAELSACGAR